MEFMRLYRSEMLNNIEKYVLNLKNNVIDFKVKEVHS